MAARQRPGEITYYEELGVDNDASPDDIRDAFRALARLLHPDQQTDTQLKDITERQMRKLNRVYAVLSDPSRRSAYNQSLESARDAPIIVFSGSDDKLKKLLVRGGIATGIIVATVLVVWFVVDNNNSNESRAQETRSALPGKAGDNADGDGSEQVAQLRAQIHTLEAERNSALLQLDRLRQKQSGTQALPAATTLTELESPTGQSPATGSSAADFAGQWVYAKAGSASPGGKAEYRPDFIEVTVTQQNGTLHGQYRARYQVLDHAASPDVNFDFSGTPRGSALNCAWQSADGAKGRMTLKLLPSSGAEIAWKATRPGSQLWLLSGTATLARK
jgi:curved DNA-binding protein CbpA